MTTLAPLVPRQIRSALFEALTVAAPLTFNGDLRRAFLVDALNLELARFEMDSLARMEFCIAIELSTGVSLLQAQLEQLTSTDAIQQFLIERLHELSPDAK